MDEQPKISSSALDKESRINLINRRSVAWLLEVAAINAVVAPVVLAVYFHARPVVLAELAQGTTAVLFPIQLAIWGVYLAIRDLVGATSFGKYLVGLGLAPSGDSAGRVPIGSRVLRNLPLIIPFVPVIEFVIAYYGNDQMQRLGDKLAKTQVVDLDTRKSLGSWSGMLLLAFLLFLGINFLLVPRLIALYLGWLG
ncbi:MAG: RDD family protein [Bradymonadales bacterium]|nr:RDD family protein [Bradymonadales bacterium]